MTRAELVRAGPYRIFFPLGVLAGLIGVGHWLFWSMGWVKESHSFFHAMIQIEGFLTCFVAGFLMTAFPRFLGAPTAALWELLLSFGLELSVIILLIEKRFAAAEISYLGVILSLIVFCLRRLPKANKVPPGFFPLDRLWLAASLNRTPIDAGQRLRPTFL